MSPGRLWRSTGDMIVRKNLVMIHLESISRANLWQFRHELNAVWRLMEKSTQFTRFYTSSCSTQMTTADVYNGFAGGYDHCAHFKGSLKKLREEIAGLPGWFASFGWEWWYFGSSLYHAPSVSKSTLTHVENNPNLPALANSFLNECAKRKETNTPFAAYFWDATSHLAFTCKPKNEAQSVQERMRVAYSLINASFTRIIDGLRELDLLKDTVILVFGDHGDEPWGHGLNQGYCHSIAPYSGICWTPMFIYDQAVTPSITDRLVSAIDLSPTIANYMMRYVPEWNEKQKLNRASILRNDSVYGVGKDVFSKRRKLAYSQNMFALQAEYDDPERGMIKGYAVTDGTYRLVVSSGGNNPGAGGMELFYEQMDPTNSRNLLDFFTLDEKGCITAFNPPPGTTGKHFIYSFRQPQIESIEKVFRRLKHALHRFIRRKESRAMQFLEGTEYHVFPEDAFTRSKQRLFGGY